jgi:hypothetical protein
MKNYLYFLIILFITNSCVKNNPKPSWIEILPWTLVENSSLGTEKELTHNFSDAYVIIDEEIVGFFELPVKFPILKEGKHQIKIYPAIQNNGIKAHGKKIYPFCATFTSEIELIKEKTVTLDPSTNYINGTKFWIEDFEDATLKISNEAVSTVNLMRGSDPEILKYGNAYGHVHLSSAESYWYGITSSGLNLPKNGTEVYLEVDYRSTNSLLTGVLAYNSNGFTDNPNIQINGQDKENIKWKKIYIELREIVSYSLTSTVFEQYFKALLDEGKTEGDIYIDNVKIVYF